MEVPPDFPAAGMEPSVTALRKLTFPGRTWSLIVDLPGFEFTRRETRDDGKGVMVVGENPQTHILISIFIEEAVRGSAIVISLISQSYLGSDYCKQELEWFTAKAAEDPVGLTVGHHVRVFPPLLYNVPPP